MKIAYAHLCDYAMISKEGKLSVIGIFDRMAPAKLPYTHPQAYLAFQIELSYAELGKEFPVRIDFVDSDGGILFRAEARLTLQGQARVGERPSVPQILGIGGMRFEKPGTYNVNIWLQDILKETIELEVAVAKKGG